MSLSRASAVGLGALKLKSVKETLDREAVLDLMTRFRVVHHLQERAFDRYLAGDLHRARTGPPDPLQRNDDAFELGIFVTLPIG